MIDLQPLTVVIEAVLRRECRECGWTLECLNHPISKAARAVRCARNGVTVERGPRLWDYAPNALVAGELETAALLSSTENSTGCYRSTCGETASVSTHVR